MRPTEAVAYRQANRYLPPTGSGTQNRYPNRYPSNSAQNQSSRRYRTARPTRYVPHTAVCLHVPDTAIPPYISLSHEHHNRKWKYQPKKRNQHTAQPKHATTRFSSRNKTAPDGDVHGHINIIISYTRTGTPQTAHRTKYTAFSDWIPCCHHQRYVYNAKQGKKYLNSLCLTSSVF